MPRTSILDKWRTRSILCHVLATSSWLEDGTGVQSLKPASRKQKVAEFTAQGKTPREIAAALDLSTQRVYQILGELRLKPARAEASA